MVNEIQEKRMKNYFIDSAKAIIRGEGVKAVSVRTVAEKAGYSYATLYNYFKNLRELYYYCILDFTQECRDYVGAKTYTDLKPEERCLAKTKSFCNYFVQYPGIYQVIFTELLTDIVQIKGLNEEINKLFLDVFSSEYEEMGDTLKCTKESIFFHHKHMVTSVLSYYLLRREPADYKDFLKNLEIIFY